MAELGKVEPGWLARSIAACREAMKDPAFRARSEAIRANWIDTETGRPVCGAPSPKQDTP